MNADETVPFASDPGDVPSDGDASGGDASGGAASGAAVGTRYAREGLLGLGGMGRVYAARDARLQRQVALKVAATPELAGRLACEARITAQLEHPGIVAVYDAGVTDGQAWYAMRLIRGRTLRERIAACPDLPARLALVPHLHAACQAVAYAHAMGIVHRDLKPSNIMVGEFGETQVADWGLARPTDAALSDWKRIVPDGGGGVAGTPRYMSPEQARGDVASPASDVYGLGGALYELLGGRPPPDPAPGERSGAPPLADDLPVEVPRELVAIARRCLQADPGARYPSAVELAEDLGRWLSGRRVEAHDYQPIELLSRLVKAWRAPLAVGGAALVVLAVVVGVALHRTARERAAADANLALALTQQARTALAEDRIPEAHVLAAHALRLGPSPEARGVIAGTPHTSATLVTRTPLPAICRHTGVVAPDASAMACHGEGRLEIWGLEPLVLRASLAMHAVERPAWVGDRLLVATTDALAWVEGGEVAGTVDRGGWPLASDTGAFVLRGASGRALKPGQAPVAFETCAATRATTLVADGELLVGCDDGQLRAYGEDGVLRRVVPLGERPPWSVATPGADGLLVGHQDGTVQILSLLDGRWGAPLRGLSGAVRALLPVPGTALVLALGERGGPRIWNTVVGAWAGALPAGASRLAPGGADGEVLLLGEALERWRLAPTPRPATLQFDAGISQVTVSPAGDALAVALGTGDVVERRLADGRELRRWRWGGEVAKCVAYARNDGLVASAMGAPGQRLGPDGEVRPLEAPDTLRRAGRLSDGRVWALPYGDAALLVEPDGGTTVQPIGPAPFDGSSSPDGGTAVLLDTRGGVWLLEGSAWREVRRVPDATAVDVGDGGAPIVVARRREVCVDEACVDVGDDIVDVALFGEHVAVTTLTGGVRLLYARTGATLAVLRGHTGRVSSVEFGPDGRWLVSASWDGTARVWDLAGLDTPAEVLVTSAAERWGLSLEAALGGG
ncbi:MAG: WD40 repeat domain-containing serine/threonine-protein kinase [Pseudomonadota bacterium]|nr:WD40 repeat domain-containing serine/threonine-protein kinase [Pseudomonadota bacterium]